MNANGTSWIKVGADVVYFYDSPRGTNNRAVLTTISSVASKSFRLDGIDARFPIQAQPRVSAGYAVHRALPAESAEGQQRLGEQIIEDAKGYVERAYTVWLEQVRRDGTRLLEATEQLNRAASVMETKLRWFEMRAEKGWWS